VVMAKGMLSTVMVKARCGLLWHCDKIGNKTEVVPGHYLSEFVRRKAKGVMGSMVGEMVATALCD
jgi:hypothetical protein